jgi:hypothetical protein
MFRFENIYYLATLGGSANPSRAFSQTEIASNQKKTAKKTKTKKLTVTMSPVYVPMLPLKKNILVQCLYFSFLNTPTTQIKSVLCFSWRD